MSVNGINQPSKTNRKATLHDIARNAGVTVGTVSGVLRGKAKERRISEEVAEKIWRVASEMDYAPNLLIRSLHRGHTNILAFLNGFRNRDRRDFYMDALTTAIERAGGAQGYNLLVLCDFSLGAAPTYQYINGANNDGLIFFKPQPDDPLLSYLRKSNLPIILVNSEDSEGVLSSVTEDWKAGIRLITDELYRLGHRRIAAFTANPWIEDSVKRTALFNENFEALGVHLRSEWQISVDGKQPGEVGDALRFVMRDPEPPTAIFCWHDYVGYTLLEHCERLGISIPEQLSVVGYDGVPFPAKTHHELATVVVDLDRMGEAAVKTLIKLVNGECEPPIRHVVPVSLNSGTTLTKPFQSLTSPMVEPAVGEF